MDGGKRPADEPEAVTIARVAAHYEHMLASTRAARADLAAALNDGLQPIKPLPSGGFNAMDGVRRSHVNRLANRYRQLSVFLYRAAEAVCDARDLPEDGKDEGIVWEVPL